MIKTKSDYENMAVKLLALVIAGQVPTIELLPECTQQDFDNLLEQCVNDKLIVGLETFRTGDGRLHCDITIPPYVTLKGLSFIETIQQTNAIDIASKNSIAANLKANKSFILSVIALLFTILINADKIVHNAQKILAYLHLI